MTVLALCLVGPLAGCGNLGNPFRSGSSSVPSRKIGTIGISVEWPERTRLIPLATNSIVVSIRDSKGVMVTGFPKVLVRPTDISGSPAVANVTATNLQVGQPSSPEVYTIQADAYPTATGTGVVQATGSTTASLTTDNPTNNNVQFTLGSTIKTVNILITDGSTASQNMGKGRQRTFLAEAKDAAGQTVITTPGKWHWEVIAPGLGGFLQTGGGVATTIDANGVTYVAGDPGSTTNDTNIRVTETESGIASANFTIRTVPLGLATTAWPRFHGNSQNLGQGTVGTAIASSVSQVWSGPTRVGPRNIVFSSGVVDTDGVLYIGAYDEATGTTGRLYAIAPDGSVKWTYSAKGKIESSPVISRDGTVYFGSFDDTTSGGYLYGVKSNAAGTAPVEVWVRQTNAPVFGSPALDSNGYLYAGTTGSDRTLYKLDALNGNFVAGWATVKGNTSIQTSPALSADEATAYFITSGETQADGTRIGASLYAVSTATGAVKWTYSTGDKSVTASSPVVSGGKVFFGTLEGLFYAVSEATGSLAWTQAFDAEAQIYSTAAVAKTGNTLYFATFDNISGTFSSRLIALDTATGNKVWSSPAFTAGFTSSPALSNDGTRLYIGAYDGNVYGINAATGAIAWTFATGTTDENFDSSPAIGPNGDVFIGSFKGDVYRLH